MDSFATTQHPSSEEEAIAAAVASVVSVDGVEENGTNTTLAVASPVPASMENPTLPSSSPHPSPNPDSVADRKKGMPALAKAAWKKLPECGNPSHDSPPVMGGAESWPSLSDVHRPKPSETLRRTPAPAPVAEIIVNNQTPENARKGLASIPNHRVEGKVEANRQKEAPQCLSRADSGNGDGEPVDPNFCKRDLVGHVLSNTSSNSRNSPIEQGVNNGHGWHGHSRGRVNGIDIKQTRNPPRHSPIFMSSNPGHVNVANFPNMSRGMYYVPVPATAPLVDPIRGVPLFAPIRPPGVLMPRSDHGNVQAMLVKQIEYYFSIENLCRDVFLRSKMDKHGFIPVSVIAGFNRVRMLVTNPVLILNALQSSSIVEVQGDRLRKRHDWDKWLLPPPTSPSSFSATSKSDEDGQPKRIEGNLNSTSITFGSSITAHDDKVRDSAVALDMGGAKSGANVANYVRDFHQQRELLIPNRSQHDQSSSTVGLDDNGCLPKPYSLLQVGADQVGIKRAGQLKVACL